AVPPPAAARTRLVPALGDLQRGHRPGRARTACEPDRDEGPVPLRVPDDDDAVRRREDQRSPVAYLGDRRDGGSWHAELGRTDPVVAVLRVERKEVLASADPHAAE